MPTRPADAMAADSLAGRVALVTGGGTGIGRACALDLARCGAEVVVCGRRAEPLEEVRTEIGEAGGSCHAVAADIRDDEQVRHVVDEAVERFGRVDVLVNNAGGQFMAPAEEITANGWRAVHRLAVDASWSMTRAVATRSMIPNRDGVIFFFSFSPRRGITGMVHAAAARAAVENLASGLALEWSRYGIRTICLAPGTIATDALLENYPSEDVRRWEQGVPLGRLGTAGEVSGLVCALASPLGSYVTGTTVTVDGGVDAWGAGEAPPRPVPTVRAEQTPTDRTDLPLELE
jgi:citronellol/citronellal dehydrogenase